MKKYLVIFLLIFVIAVGFSGAVSAAHVPKNHGNKILHGQPSVNINVEPKITIAPTIIIAPTVIYAPIINSPGTTFAPIINSPGTTFVGGNYNSYTGGNGGITVNTIGSTTNFNSHGFIAKM